MAGDLTSTAAEDLEFFAFEKIVEARKLTNELLEKYSTLFDKLSILVTGHLHLAHVDAATLLWDSWNVAPGPSIVQHSLQGLKFIESSLTAPLTCGVAPCQCVLGDLAHFDWVSDGESERCLLGLVLVILTGALYLLPRRVEGLDLLNELRLGVVGSHVEILIDIRDR